MQVLVVRICYITVIADMDIDSLASERSEPRALNSTRLRHPSESLASVLPSDPAAPIYDKKPATVSTDVVQLILDKLIEPEITHQKLFGFLHYLRPSADDVAFLEALAASSPAWRDVTAPYRDRHFSLTIAPGVVPIVTHLRRDDGLCQHITTLELDFSTEPGTCEESVDSAVASFVGGLQRLKHVFIRNFNSMGHFLQTFSTVVNYKEVETLSISGWDAGDAAEVGLLPTLLASLDHCLRALELHDPGYFSPRLMATVASLDNLESLGLFGDFELDFDRVRDMDDDLQDIAPSSLIEFHYQKATGDQCDADRWAIVVILKNAKRLRKLAVTDLRALLTALSVPFPRLTEMVWVLNRRGRTMATEVGWLACLKAPMLSHLVLAEHPSTYLHLAAELSKGRLQSLRKVSLVRLHWGSEDYAPQQIDADGDAFEAIMNAHGVDVQMLPS